jgi:hypothetical protein
MVMLYELGMYADMFIYFLEQKIWYNHYIRQKELLQLQD